MMPFADIQTRLQSLKKLEVAWAERNPQRAQGGKRAITGFRYQFQVYLLRLVEHWLSLPSEERSNVALFCPLAETISDILQIEKNNLIVATQVKLTLRSAPLTKALDEFLTIHTAAAEDCPELVPILRYRLLCGKSDLINVKKSISQWADNHRSKLGEVVNQLVAVIHPVIEEIPEHKLLNRLANDLKCAEPLQITHKWLGLMLAKKDISEVHVDIWNDLQLLWRESSNKVENLLYLWCEDDIPPQEVKPGKFLTGQKIFTRHLREGYFSNRPKVYGNLEGKLIDWIDNNDYETDNESDKIPLFWIAGRSGTGKSAALLHMVARLYEKGYAPVIWLANYVAHLGPAIQFTINNALSGCRPIIAIDDPYMASTQEGASRYWHDVLASLHAVRQKEGSSNLPLIVVCGPTEQAESFRDDFGEDIDVCIEELPHKTDDELNDLRDWFFRRTGSEAPPTGDKNVLMVQMFFQWEKHETVKDFAQRLRKRLVTSDPSGDLLTLVSRILALNRLYVGYPSAAVRPNLKPEQQDVLDYLERELHVGEREENGHQTYWLLHSHLANAIYLNWYDGKPSSFKEYLREGILDCLDFPGKTRDKVAPLWAISRVLELSTDDFSKRLDRPVAISLLSEIYKTLAEKYEVKLPQFLMPVWVEIDATVPELNLQPSPIHMAIESINPININENGLRLTCHKLLEHYPRFQEAQKKLMVDVFINLLANTQDWRHWMPVADHSLSTFKDVRLIPLIVENLNNIEGDERIARLLSDSLQAYPDEPRISAVAVAWLKKVNPNHASWQYVWQALFNHDSHREELRIIALAWLQQADPNHAAWQYVWQVLFKEDTNSEVLREVAIKWLAVVNVCHASWQYVWRLLFEKDKDNGELWAIALKWLQEVDPTHGSWQYVWQTLFERDTSSEVLRGFALKWLQQIEPDCRSWARVWEILIEQQGMSEAMQAVGLKWLQDVNPNSTSWKFVWQVLYEQNTTDETVRAIAIKWLSEVDQNHFAWGLVWEALFKQDPKSDALRMLAIRWLQRGDLVHESWHFVWEALWLQDTESKILKEIALKWLGTVDQNHIAWAFPWQALFDQESSEELWSMGKKWLMDVDQNHPSWQRVWDVLFKSQIKKQELRDIALKWLDIVDPNHSSWQYVWKTLIDQDS